jgi:hypothetical protein
VGSCCRCGAFGLSLHRSRQYADPRLFEVAGNTCVGVCSQEGYKCVQRIYGVYINMKWLGELRHRMLCRGSKIEREERANGVEPTVDK